MPGLPRPDCTETSHPDHDGDGGVPGVPVDDTCEELIWSDIDGSTGWKHHGRPGDDHETQNSSHSTDISHIATSEVFVWSSTQLRQLHGTRIPALTTVVKRSSKLLGFFGSAGAISSP
jgi:hypothetical protein